MITNVRIATVGILLGALVLVGCGGKPSPTPEQALAKCQAATSEEHYLKTTGTLPVDFLSGGDPCTAEENAVDDVSS